MLLSATFATVAGELTHKEGITELLDPELVAELVNGMTEGFEVVLFSFVERLRELKQDKGLH